MCIGFSIKEAESFQEIEIDTFTGKESVKTTVNDWGILLNIPVIKLINEKMQVRLNESLIFLPTFNFSLGYSKSNLGDSVYYLNPFKADPLPRVDRTGYGLSPGFDLISKNLSLNMFTISFTSEAEDILVTRDTTGNWEYQSSFSDLNFWKNIDLKVMKILYLEQGRKWSL